MSKNISYALRMVRDRECYRVGNKVMVKNPLAVVAPDVRPLVDGGWVRIDPATGRVTITLDGLLRVRDALNYRTRKKAEDFFRDHDSFYFLDDTLRATDGGYISRYVADFFIEDGTLVLRPDGRYGKAITLIEVGPGEVAAVREFLLRMRSAT